MGRKMILIICHWSCDRSRDVALATINVGAIWRNCHVPPSLFALAFDSALVDRKAVVRTLHVSDSSTLFRNLVSLHSVTSEFTRLECILILV